MIIMEPAQAPQTVAAAPKRPRAGRPPKWIAPADGTPMTREMKVAIHNREYMSRLYKENAALICARNRKNYHARKAKQIELLRELQTFKASIAALAAA